MLKSLGTITFRYGSFMLFSLSSVIVKEWDRLRIIRLEAYGTVSSVTEDTHALLLVLFVYFSRLSLGVVWVLDPR